MVGIQQYEYVLLSYPFKCAHTYHALCHRKLRRTFDNFSVYAAAQYKRHTPTTQYKRHPLTIMSPGFLNLPDDAIALVCIIGILKEMDLPALANTCRQLNQTSRAQVRWRSDLSQKQVSNITWIGQMLVFSAIFSWCVNAARPYD